MNNKQNKVQMLIVMASLIQKEGKNIDSLCNAEIVNISQIERSLRHLGGYYEEITKYLQEIKQL